VYYKEVSFDVSSFIQAVFIFLLMNGVSLIIGYYLNQLPSFDYLFFVLNLSVIMAYYSYLYLATYKAYQESDVFNPNSVVIPFVRGLSIFISYQFLLLLFYFSFFATPMIVVILGVLSVILYFLTGNIYHLVTKSYKAFYNQTGLIFMMMFGHLFGYLILPIKDAVWSYYLGFIVFVLVVIIGGLIFSVDRTTNKWIKDGTLGKVFLFFGVILFLVTTAIPAFRPTSNLFDSSVSKQDVIKQAYELTFDEDIEKVISYEGGYYVLTKSHAYWYQNHKRRKELSLDLNQTLANTKHGVVIISRDVVNHRLVLRFLEEDFSFIKEQVISDHLMENPVFVFEKEDKLYFFDDIQSAANINKIHYFDGTTFTTQKDEVTDDFYKDDDLYLSVSDGVMVGIIKYYQPFDQYEYRLDDAYYSKFYTTEIGKNSYRYVHYNDQVFYYQLWLDSKLKITKKESVMSDYIELETGSDPLVYVSDDIYFIDNLNGFYVYENDQIKRYEARGNLYYSEQGFLFVERNTVSFTFYSDYNVVIKSDLVKKTDYLIVLSGLVIICFYKKSWFE